MTGENQYRELECYNVYQQMWVQMYPYRGLLYKDYRHSRVCIVRECGMEDSDCQGIGRAVRKCHKNLLIYESVGLQVPMRYTAQAHGIGSSIMPYLSESEDEGYNVERGGQ